MKNFAQLFTTLDQSNKTNDKVAALVHYFNTSSDADKLWCMALLSGKRPKRTVNTTFLRLWAAEMAAVPTWLFEESYHIVGDLAETITLLLPEASQQSDEPLHYWMDFLQKLELLDETGKKTAILSAWDQLDKAGRFVFNKLITGSFRVGVSQQLMIKALAGHTGRESNHLAHRLMGSWSPLTADFASLTGNGEEEDISRPYPFCLAYPLEEANKEAIGEPSGWIAERKWDGIRGQVIVRQGQLFVWSRGEELVTDKYPEYAHFPQYLPNGIVIDGEIMPWKDGQPLSFQLLQTRIGRKTVNKKQLAEAPVILMAYDLLEHQGTDIRQLPFTERRRLLEEVAVNIPSLQLSPLVAFTSWEQLAAERAQSASYHSEGIMLKKKDSVYKVGRKKGDWWKWKIDPMSIDAVLIYAQRGHGRRANLYSDYTFAVWHEDKLVPFTKAYSGLTDAEIGKVDAWIKRNTLEKFGPVRSVTPTLVFEIGFEGINRSPRHKSGVALRFPRILRWRTDKVVADADHLESLMQLLHE